MLLPSFCYGRGGGRSWCVKKGLFFVETSLVFQGNKKVVTDVESR